MKLNIVMVEPEIPQNTGNIARTCAITGSKLHLVHPLGFKIDEKSVKRAGLDYWDKLDIEEHESLEDFLNKYKPEENKMFFATTKGTTKYTDIDYSKMDEVFVLYGKETKDDSFVSKLIVEKDVTLKGKYGLAIFWDTKNGSHGASVDFYGKVDVTNNGIATNGDILNEDGPVVNIKKGAVVKSTGADGVAVYCAGNGTYNIEDGATITGATGIEVRAGKLNVKGGTITGTAKELTSKANGGGSTTAGAGIAVVQHTTQLPIEVNITGGTITGAEALYVNNTQGNPTTAWAKVNVTVAGGTFNTDVTKFLGDKYVVNKNGNTYAIVENKVLETTDEKVVFESAEAIRNDLVLKVTEKTEDEIKKGTEKVTEAYKDNKKVKEVKLINLYEINVKK